MLTIDDNLTALQRLISALNETTDVSKAATAAVRQFGAELRTWARRAYRALTPQERARYRARRRQGDDILSALKRARWFAKSRN